MKIYFFDDKVAFDSFDPTPKSQDILALHFQSANRAKVSPFCDGKRARDCRKSWKITFRRRGSDRCGVPPARDTIYQPETKQRACISSVELIFQKKSLGVMNVKKTARNTNINPALMSSDHVCGVHVEANQKWVGW